VPWAFRVVIGLLCLTLAAVWCLLIPICGPTAPAGETGLACAAVVAGLWAFALLGPRGRAVSSRLAAGGLGLAMAALCVTAAVDWQWRTALFAAWVGYVGISYALRGNRGQELETAVEDDA
jgi:hypothetical protein